MADGIFDTLRAKVGRFLGDVDCQNLTVRGRMVNSPWATPTLTNGWVPNDAPAPTARNPLYRRLASGLEVLVGVVKNGGANTSVFQLPVGHRPAAQRAFICATSAVTGIVFVNTDGTIVPQGNLAWVQLDGITFVAEQ
ncbi:MAG TPA: hypothetical protein VNW96_19225 [Mycobacterium sp.]|jgi:hypothetical protein|nr:hypothetical protein [Mycobacterium sp.]